MKLVSVGYEAKESFPEECFWSFICKAGKPGVFRIVSNDYQNWIELFGESDKWNQKIIQQVEKISVRDSIYRNQFLQVDIETPLQDEYDLSLIHI